MKHYTGIRKKRKIFLITLIVTLTSAYLFMMIPGSESPGIINQEEFKTDGIKSSAINDVEKYFSIEEQDCSTVDTLFSIIDSIKKELNFKSFYTDDVIFDTLKNNFLMLSALVAKCSYRLNDLIALQSGITITLKKQFRSRVFNRERFIKLYSHILTNRIAVEEAIITEKDTNYISRIRGIDEPSASPLTREAGLFLRSGDIILSVNDDLFQNILLSGNEFHGSFSNVSLVYVDDTTRAGFVMNSDIKSGAELKPAGDFFKNIRNRFLILRVSASDTLLLIDSLIPHKSAKLAFDEISNNRIRYDYTPGEDENFSNAELVQYYYEIPGMNFSVEGINISPAVFEVSPSLVEVFEVRDQSSLIRGRIKEFSIRALIKMLRENEIEDQNIFLLPVARLIKLYSIILENFDKEGPIPAGMPADEALKLWILNKEYGKIHSEVEKFVRDFKDNNGRFPNYREMEVSISR
jgi:hypothetical protein